MTDLSKTLRSKLIENAQIGQVELINTIKSNETNTQKFLFKVSGGHFIESVYIPEKERNTLCISSQVGCALNCSFCATGAMGFSRNLSVGEITDQLLFAQNYLQLTLTNIVLMGMGEPFMNYNNVINAAKLISHEKGIAIGQKRIVISTAGWVPAIIKFANEGYKFRLAISLNAANKELRSKIMPVTKKYSLGELINAVKYYYQKCRLRPTFEYVLLAGVNDSKTHAAELRNLIQDVPCKINLIPYNPIGDRFKRPSNEQISQFAEWLYPLRAPVIIRWSKGDDIKGACGQLAGNK